MVGDQGQEALAPVGYERLRGRVPKLYGTGRAKIDALMSRSTRPIFDI